VRPDRAWVTTSALLGAALLALAAADAPSRSTPYPARLPEGPGRELAEGACMVCHSGMLIVQQRKDAAGWEKTVALMEKWGAPLAPAERDSLLRYLARNLGPPGGSTR
jgi:hypothetical protein